MKRKINSYLLCTFIGTFVVAVVLYVAPAFAADQFSSNSVTLNSPANNAFAITPDDDTDLAVITRAVYIGADGDLKVLLVGDTTPVTYVGLKAGTTKSIRIKRVYETDTTAESLIGEY